MNHAARWIMLSTILGIALGAGGVSWFVLRPAIAHGSEDKLRADRAESDAAKYRIESAGLNSQLSLVTGSLVKAQTLNKRLGADLQRAQITVGELNATVDRLAGIGETIDTGAGEIEGIASRITDLAQSALSGLRQLQGGP